MYGMFDMQTGQFMSTVVLCSENIRWQSDRTPVLSGVVLRVVSPLNFPLTTCWIVQDTLFFCVPFFKSCLLFCMFTEISSKLWFPVASVFVLQITKARVQHWKQTHTQLHFISCAFAIWPKPYILMTTTSCKTLCTNVTTIPKVHQTHSFFLKFFCDQTPEIYCGTLVG